MVAGYRLLAGDAKRFCQDNAGPTAMVEIVGEVQEKVVEQRQPPSSRIFDKKDTRTIPILKLRLTTASGSDVQVLFKGEFPGDARMNDQVRVRGVSRGGVIHATSIYNESTNSWVTPKPGLCGGRQCFVVTAAYGGGNSPQVALFLRFRDEVLTALPSGDKAISLYYKLSPRAAAILAERAALRRAVRVFFLDPLSWVVRTIFFRGGSAR